MNQYMYDGPVMEFDTCVANRWQGSTYAASEKKARSTQEMFDVVDDCSKCKLNTDTYELLQVGTGFWSGDYAMVQKDGKITKVSLNRVYDVKESL